MHTDQLSIENKIITSETLLDIFRKLDETLSYYKRVYKKELRLNKSLKTNKQKWTFKDNNSKLIFKVKFNDHSTITYDNCNNFIGIYNNRLKEILEINVLLELNYQQTSTFNRLKTCKQHITMNIKEDDASIDVALINNDDKLDDTLLYIRNKILVAPVKYDSTIKNKNHIEFIITLSTGLYKALGINTILLIFKFYRNLFSYTYFLYPLLTIILALIIGGIIKSRELEELYKNMIPKEIIKRHDNINDKDIYKDDIKSFISSSEILIGKNTDNLENRIKIVKLYKNTKNKLVIQIAILIIISILVTLL